MLLDLDWLKFVGVVVIVSPVQVYILGQENGYVVFTLVLQMRLQNDSWKFDM